MLLTAGDKLGPYKSSNKSALEVGARSIVPATHAWGVMSLRLAVLLVLSSSMRAQSFEVATIKAAAPDAEGQFIRPSPGHLTITNMTLLQIIRFAYGEGISGNIEITGGPGWIDRDRYDIEAKSEGSATLPERKQMTKGLLADRFGLKVHTQTKEVNVYSMTVARSDGKLGPKVQTWDGTCGGRDAPPRSANPTGPRCGAFFRPPGMVMEGAPMGVVADMLSSRIPNLSRPVVDKTGLTGEYTMQLEFRFQPPGPAGAAAPVDEFSESLFTAIQEQLGVKLQSEKAQVEYLVIDQAERPTED